jgi:hypothetical protein
MEILRGRVICQAGISMNRAENAQSHVGGDPVMLITTQ